MSEFREYIDEYLEGKLGEDLATEFTEQLSNDPVLREELDFHIEVISGISYLGNLDLVRSVEDELDRTGFFSDAFELNVIDGIEKYGDIQLEEMISDVDKELADNSFYESQKERKEAKVRTLVPRRRWLAIAASVLILVVGGIAFWPDQQNGSQMFVQNFEIPADALSAEIIEEQKEIGFADDIEDLNTLKNSYDQYKAKDFEAFIESSEPLLDLVTLQHYKDRILFYRGIAYTQTGEYQNAIIEFDQSAYSNADWYKLLAYLALDDLAKAKEIGNNIEDPTETQMKLINKLGKL